MEKNNLNLAVENFCGVTSASMTIKPGITLLAGANGSGKTTFLMAIAACVRPDAIIPVPDLLKKDSWLLVRDGSGSGSATLTGPGGSRRVVWPSNGAKGNGPFNPAPSRMALGLVDWGTTHSTERAKILQETAALDPSLAMTVTKEDIDKAVADKDVEPKFVDWIWQVIQAEGSTAANTAASKAAQDATGGWRATTGEVYGSAKGQAYFPAGWEPDLETATMESLKQAVADARATVEHAIANQAVDAAEVKRVADIAQEAIPELLPLEVAVAEAKTSLEPKIRELKESLKPFELHNTPRLAAAMVGFTSVDIVEVLGVMTSGNDRKKEIQGENVHLLSGKGRVDGTCPGCEIPLLIRRHESGQYELSITPQEIDTSRIDALKLELIELETVIAEANTKAATFRGDVERRMGQIKKELSETEDAARGAVADAGKKLADARKQKATIEAAQARLAEMQSRIGGVSEADIAASRDMVRRAESRMNAWVIKTNADQYAKAIRQYTVLKDITGVGGVRKQKMERTISAFNAMLENLSGMAGWGVVSINADGDMFYDGRPYIMASRARKFRCRVTVQVMLAVVEKAPLLLIDDVDTLDSDGRQGLVTILKHVGITSVISMMAKHDYASAIAQIFHSAFWIENGTVIDIKPSA